MKNLLFFVFICLVLLGCRSEEEDRPRELLYFYQENSSLAIDSTGKFSIVPGKNLVFKYQDRALDTNNDSIDSEIRVGVSFEVPSNQEEFYLEDEKLKEANCHYFNIHNGPFEPGALYLPIKKGSIKGKKISPTLWEVRMDLDISYLDNRKLVQQNRYQLKEW